MMKPSIASLLAHPRTVSQFVDTIETQLIYGEKQTIELAYRLTGNLNRLRIPAPHLPRRADRLWHHTCFEVFIKASAGTDYYEFNFSPSGEWAVYTFHGYRDGGPFDDEKLDPAISVGSEDAYLKLRAVVDLDRLPAIRPIGKLLIGLSAVIEASDGTLSYWALKHPSDKPNFHHPDSFALELALAQERA